MSLKKLGKKLRVLVVDDDAVCREAITLLLKEHYRCEIEMAENATDALDLVNDCAFEWDEKGFDVILMDIFLPDIHGDSLTDVIRKTEAQTKNTPIIAISSKVTEKDKKTLQSMGITDLVIKPVTLKNLDQVFRKYVQNIDQLVIPKLVK